MQTLHSVRGATIKQSQGYADMYALVLNYMSVYDIHVDDYDVNYLADDIAKIKYILDNNDSIVICSTNKSLGPVGITLSGGIKRAFSEDVYSTIEERQTVVNDLDITLTEHVEPSKEGYWAYPEYWVCNAEVLNVWVDVKEVSSTYVNSLSQMAGLILGLSVTAI